MNVSCRNIVAGLAALAATCGGAIALAQNSPGSGHIINTPSLGGTTNSSSGCCQNVPRDHVVRTPSARIGAPNIVIGGASAQVGSNQVSIGGSSVVGGSGGSGLLILNQGGSLPVGDTFETTLLENLNVDGAEQYVTKTVTKKKPVTQNVCVPDAGLGAAPVQAVCIDDKGAPHPASQTFKSERVDASYTGEVFRCVAGSSLQVTIGALDGAGTPSFDRGRTMSCKKGEALVHKPGGDLSCAPQKPRRDCNERSLLRKYGPGIKLVDGQNTCTPTQRVVMKEVTQEVRVRKQDTGSLILDGGVGQGLY